MVKMRLGLVWQSVALVGLVAALGWTARGAAAANTPAPGTADAVTVLGTKLMCLSGARIEATKKDGKLQYTKPLRQGDMIEVVEVENVKVPQREGNVIWVKVLRGDSPGQTVDVGLKAVVHDGKTEFKERLCEAYAPLPENAPAWVDMNPYPPHPPGEVETAVLIKALESKTEDWQVRFHAATLLQLKAETERAALESLARTVGDSRREVRMAAAWCLQRSRKFVLLQGRETQNFNQRGVEQLASVVPILAAQLEQHPEQVAIVDLLRRSGSASVPAMVKLLVPPYTQASAMSAASVLCEFPEPAKEHTTLLWKALAAGNNWALQAAFLADGKGTLEQLLAQIGSKDAAVRRRGAECLFLLGPMAKADLVKWGDTVEKAVGALREGLKSGDGAVVRWSVRALPWFGKLALPAIGDLDKLAAQKPADVSPTEIQDATARIRAYEK